MLGRSDEEAKDLTQGFFAHLIEKNVLARADPKRGRLRTFLITALNQHVIGEWRRETAGKRGGDEGMVSLDLESFLSHSSQTDDFSQFDRAWAEQVFERSLLALERVYRGRGKEKLISAIIPYLGRFDEAAGEMEPLARELGITLPALRVHLHRARKRFGDCLRDELRALQTPEAEIEDELRYLVSLLDE
jgi:RNA polymerase sigma-70 factor (ECF subfamily)